MLIIQIFNFSNSFITKGWKNCTHIEWKVNAIYACRNYLQYPYWNYFHDQQCNNSHHEYKGHFHKCNNNLHVLTLGTSLIKHVPKRQDSST